MHGICVDALNPTNRPTARQLRLLGVDSVRMVLFDDPQFWDYYTALKMSDFKVALVLAGESFQSPDFHAECAALGARLNPVPPDLLIFGNEPNAQVVERIEVSSWITSPAGYISFYDQCVAGFKSTLTLRVSRPGGVPISIAGLLGSKSPTADGWLDSVLPHINVVPDFLNIHYPNDEGVLNGWTAYGIPLVVGEWRYKGRRVKKSDVVDWMQVLNRWAQHTFWFCWGYRTEYAVVSPVTGRKLAAFDHLTAALDAVRPDLSAI